MKAIINTSYLVGDINIPGTDKAYVADVIDKMILKHQNRFMEKVLGYALYWPIKEAIEDSEKETDPVPLPIEISNLMNGMETREYTHVGIKNLYAFWIYHRYMGKSQTETTTTGESSAKKTNAARASSIYKMVDAWNEMCDQSVFVRNYLKDPYFVGIAEPAPIEWRPCCSWKDWPLFEKENILNI
ncbi:MAG TPA: hypothetical protein VHA52_08740 [Candidatus Babeliaceae bacterium]|nr:hypothetical protein [Candidatus Babeliaceae bacterium]